MGILSLFCDTGTTTVHWENKSVVVWTNIFAISTR